MPIDGKLFLLDANSLITSQSLYYPQEMIPELWEWMLNKAHAGLIKIPLEIYDEVLAGKDDRLTIWLKKPNIKDQLVLAEAPNADLVAQVTYEGYAQDLNDIELAQIGRDPFLIAYGLIDPAKRCVVSFETSKPSTKRQNRKVPDVCDGFGVECCTVFQMLRRLGFKTAWNKQ